MLLLAALSACAPATLQTARTNGEGNFQFAVEPGVLAAVGGGGAAVIPALNLSGRYGVSDRVDMGLRIGTLIYQLKFLLTYEYQLKFLLTDPAATDTTAVSIAPSTFLFFVGASGAGLLYWDTRVPVLFGIPTGDGSEFTVGPKVHTTVLGAGGGGVGGGGLILYAGGTVGYAAKVGDKFRIMPGIDLEVPIVAGVTASTTGTGTSVAVTGFDGVLVLGGVGFMFGGPDN